MSLVPIGNRLRQIISIRPQRMRMSVSPKPTIAFFRKQRKRSDQNRNKGKSSGKPSHKKNKDTVYYLRARHYLSKSSRDFLSPRRAYRTGRDGSRHFSTRSFELVQGAIENPNRVFSFCIQFFPWLELSMHLANNRTSHFINLVEHYRRV